MDDTQAISQLKQGDWRGLEALVSVHQHQAIRAAFLIVQDRMLAEDVVQDAFLNAARKIGQLDTGRPFRPWFLRSVVNASIKAARRQQRQVSLNGDYPEEHTELRDWLTSPDPSPEDIVEVKDLQLAVRLALEQLTPKQRAAVVMRYYLEMSGEEMAEEAGSTVSAVKWSLYAARERLRKILRPFKNKP